MKIKSIQSKIALLIDARANENSVVKATIKTILFDFTNQRIIIKTSEKDSETLLEVSKGGSSIFTEAEFDGLFQMLQNDIVTTESFTEQFKNLAVNGQIAKMQQEPLYGSSPIDWEIVTNEETE